MKTVLIVAGCVLGYIIIGALIGVLMCLKHKENDFWLFLTFVALWPFILLSAVILDFIAWIYNTFVDRRL